MGYGNYIEQITYFIFHKMVDEQEKASQQVLVPNKYAWDKLVKLDDDDLELQYSHARENLGKESSMFGTIFCKTQNKSMAPPSWNT